MQRSTLIVDDDEVRRRQLVQALSRRGLRYLDVADAFGAMAALGRADFGCVIATEGRRTLSLRGLCQLARRRHPDIIIFIVHREGSDPTKISGILGTQVDVLSHDTSPEKVAAAIDDALSRPKGDFIEIPPTSETIPNLHLDEDPTIKTPIMSPAPAPILNENTQPGVSIGAQRAPVIHDAGSGDTQPLAAVPVPLSSSPSTTTGMPIVSLDSDEQTEKLTRHGGVLRPAAAATGAGPGGAVVVGGAAAPAPIELAPQPTPPLLEGLLDGGTGPGLLMGIFAQELTGKLVVKDGPAAGTLYFYRGEPVWADDPLGDAGLHRRLVQRGRLPADAEIRAVAPGQLLGSLVQRNLLTGQAMHDFMRELVRDVVLTLATASSGVYRFDEDKKFLDVAPLLKVNPFGLVLESRRKSMTPAQLLALSNEIEASYVVPAPGLVSAADKLAPFVRGARLDHVVDGRKTVRDLLEYTSLDQFMGTLVMITLKDAKLVSFEAAPRETAAGGVTLSDAQLSDEPREITLVDAEIDDTQPGSSQETQAREEIFQLYMRLKPLTVPRQVLGVGLDAELEEVEKAYQERMRELDPRRVPEGSAQQLLMSRMEELRRKVTSAYQALKLQLSM